MAAKRYEVVGPHAVFGHAPGKQFKGDLDPWVEATLVEGGHIAVVQDSEPKETSDE